MPMFLFNPILLADNATPSPGSVEADIDFVSIEWRPSDERAGDLDPTGFTLQASGQALVVASSSSLGAGVYRARGDVGLFPESTPTVSAGAISLIGLSASVSWSFSTRDGVSNDLAPLVADLGHVEPKSFATLADITQATWMQGNVTSSITEIEPIGVAGANSSITTLGGAASLAAASLAMYATAANEVHASLTPAFVTAGEIPVEHFTVQFSDVGESTLARFHFAAAFVVAAFNSLCSCVEAVEPVEVAATVEGLPNVKEWRGSLRVGGESSAHIYGLALDIYRAHFDPANNSLSAGLIEIAPATAAVEAITGSGVDTLFDIADGELDALTDE